MIHRQYNGARISGMRLAQQFGACRIAKEDRHAARVQSGDQARIVLERDIADTLRRQKLGQQLADAAEPGDDDLRTTASGRSRA